jgi:ATP-dependent Clp protease protease subunit
MKSKETKKLMDEFNEDFSDMEGLFDTTLPDPTMVEFYRRLKNREILWNDDIDDATIDIALYIKKWNDEDKDLAIEDRQPIKIFINSDGGYAATVLHVIDMIHLSKTPVYTIGMGRVYSAGGLLLMAGHKRYIFPHTSCLIHDGSSGAIGSIGKMIDNLEFTKELEKRIKQYILSSTRITEEIYDQNYRRDWFMFSEEIIKLGIADEIVTDIDTIL